MPWETSSFKQIPPTCRAHGSCGLSFLAATAKSLPTCCFARMWHRAVRKDRQDHVQRTTDVDAPSCRQKKHNYLDSHLSIYSIYQSIDLFYLSTYLDIYLSRYLSTYLSICLSVCLSIYIAIYLSIHPFIYLSIYPSSYLSISSVYLSIYLSLSLSLSVYLSTCLSASLKTKLFCETSSFFEVDNIKNEAILRDLFIFWT